ncbi:hypothetical protein OOU_Y34scaffold00365g1, partial [Pyricularia oryzae Y34]
TQLERKREINQHSATASSLAPGPAAKKSSHPQPPSAADSGDLRTVNLKNSDQVLLTTGAIGRFHNRSRTTITSRERPQNINQTLIAIFVSQDLQSQRKGVLPCVSIIREAKYGVN